MSSKNQQTLSNMIDEQQRDKQPERDLWPGIEQALVRESVTQVKAKSAIKPSFAIAASVLIAVFVGWFGFESGKSIQGEALVAALSEQHQSQKQSLLIRYKDSPATTSNWQEQLDELDKAATAIKAALNEDPNNAALLKMLKHVYEQQMQIIERVHQPAWNQI